MKNFKYLFIFAVSFLSAGVLWSIVGIFLPKFPVTYIPETFGGEFYNIDLSKIFISQPLKKRTVKKQNTKKHTVYTLEGIKLKAIYNDGKRAFIIVEDKGKSVFLDLNQEYKGYKLIKVSNSYAVFEKNSKEYTLTFETAQNKNVKKTDKKLSRSYSGTSNTKKVSKKTIETYKKNFSKIWNDIGIIRVKNGYKITYIRKNSIFDKLGLKRGDIIIKVNGIKLTNDAEAWYLYNHIENYDTLEIVIKRNNRTKVINYEID